MSDDRIEPHEEELVAADNFIRAWNGGLFSNHAIHEKMGRIIATHTRADGKTAREWKLAYEVTEGLRKCELEGRESAESALKRAEEGLRLVDLFPVVQDAAYCDGVGCNIVGCKEARVYLASRQPKQPSKEGGGE